MSETFVTMTLKVGHSQYDTVFEEKTHIRVPIDCDDTAGMEKILNSLPQFVSVLSQVVLGAAMATSADDALKKAAETKAVGDANHKRWMAENEKDKAVKEVATIKETAKCFIDAMRANGVDVTDELASQMGVGPAKPGAFDESSPF